MFLLLTNYNLGFYFDFGLAELAAEEPVNPTPSAIVGSQDIESESSNPVGTLQVMRMFYDWVLENFQPIAAALEAGLLFSESFALAQLFNLTLKYQCLYGGFGAVWFRVVLRSPSGPKLRHNVH